MVFFAFSVITVSRCRLRGGSDARSFDFEIARWRDFARKLSNILLISTAYIRSAEPHQLEDG